MTEKTIDEIVRETLDWDVEFSNDSGMLDIEKATIDGKEGLSMTFWNSASHCRKCYPEVPFGGRFPVQYKYLSDNTGVDWTMGAHHNH